MTYYDHAQIREFWQYVWERDDVYAVPPDASDPTYVLGMFPYTSGTLHMGHIRNYAITDAYARYRRMCGDAVLHPMGWDSFGLPAENAAHERATDPESWTRACIRRMREELKTMGFGYDWSREITTCDPSYYRWNQWLFARLYENGLVKYDAAAVNWCPNCETVLADAQVQTPGTGPTDDIDVSSDSAPLGSDEDRFCWRCETPVETRSLDQWFLTITDYAEELHRGLDELDGWPEGVREIQRNWIGRTAGARIAFSVLDGDDIDTVDKSPSLIDDDTIEVFSTRLDTIYGATFLALSPGHDLTQTIAGTNEAVASYVADVRGKSRDAVGYTGVKTDIRVRHPVTGAELPVYVAGYVLDDVGTGAIMGVPAHNEWDFAFASEHDLPIERVIEPKSTVPTSEKEPGGETETSTIQETETESLPESGSESEHGATNEGDSDDTAIPYTHDGVLTNSGDYCDLDSKTARKRILADCDAVTETVTYRLRDWLISRQRYWGTPIPIIHCETCGPVLVPDEDLPVELPEFVQSTGNPLEAQASFVETTCPTCGAPATRETDTMDTFIDSSWYFLRFLSPELEDAPFDTKVANETLPIDVYVGGEEHAILHLLYIRFFTKALADIGLLDVREPVDRLVSQGTVLYDGEKMSTSKGNVVSPDEYGAETTRLFVLTAAHPEQDFEWTANTVRNAYDLQQTLYRMVIEYTELDDSREESQIHDEYVDTEIDRTITIVTEEFERFRFHRAATEISALARLLRHYREYDLPHDPTYRRGLKTLAVLVAPLAPHLGEELWSKLREDGLVTTASWPDSTNDVSTVKRNRRLIETIRDDVRAIVDVAAIDDPTSIEIVVAHPWKYRAAELIRQSQRLGKETTNETTDGDDTTRQQENRVDPRTLVDDISEDDEVDAPKQVVAPFVVDALDRTTSYRNPPSATRERRLLEEAVWLLEDEFDASVTVGIEDDPETESNARPGKPAIQIE